MGEMSRYIYEKLMKSKYILYWESCNIFQWKAFNNRLGMRNFIVVNNIQQYYIKQNY